MAYRLLVIQFIVFQVELLSLRVIDRYMYDQQAFLHNIQSLVKNAKFVIIVMFVYVLNELTRREWVLENVEKERGCVGVCMYVCT